ncbi:hypothetical protein BN2476_1250018 [Paraburkholderia piptadeniae]|uniref:AAA+ ATPase domain-containing protein n=2 Tax=Paraburkholderia TaxID=1822464 RepID=A0A7X1NJS5_9BURK|nr:MULTISPECIES: hypothetical protein [Paraburkholderia]MPW23267.1 hypothetical protein [Paraburkholderia franconis]SIT51619.1 hypothetical protein BN2476_1250018 [Paraburkholderia piptadeniae]
MESAIGERSQRKRVERAVQSPWVASGSLPGRLRPATYRTDEMNPRYAGNPTILCFPGYPDDATALEFLANEPKARQADFMTLPKEVRIEFCDQIKEVFVPAFEHIDGFQTMMRVLRGKYGETNPLTGEFMNHLHRICLTGSPITLRSSGGYEGSTGGIVMFGPTGSGKSCLINRVCSYVGDGGVLHTALGGKPCRWPEIMIVRISAAGRATVKQLALGIASEVDDICGNNGVFERRLGSSTQYVTRTAVMLTSNLVGLLIIEDVQLWGRVDKRLRLSMLDFLVGVQEESRVPIMCVGTMLLLDVLEAHMSQSEKLMTLGQIPLLPILNDEDMNNICNAFWRWRVTAGDPEPPEWLAYEVKAYTAGLRRYIRKYFSALLACMAQDGVVVPTRKYVREIAEKYMQPVLEAVRIINRAYCGKRVDRNALQKYEEYIGSDDYRRRVAERTAALSERIEVRSRKMSK